MTKKTPFHQRLEPYLETKIWKHWSGYLVAPRYQYSEVAEYYAIRNAVAVLDTSPLFKYLISGADAEALLERVMARDIRQCKTGQCQYTCWCDDRGFVVQDGVVMHTRENEYWLTAAEPSLRYLRMFAREMGLKDVDVQDVSDAFGILAIQGPHSISVLKRLDSEIETLGYFDVTHVVVDGCPIIVSRTGFTGDLGYELWIRSEDAEKVWDLLMRVGMDFNATPMGTTALKMARVEAGLLLMDVDFKSARHAWVDAQRDTPIELGWKWMFRGLAKDDRDFVGRKSIEDEIANKTSRWLTVGLEVDWRDYERVHLEAGIMPPMNEVYRESTMSIYRRGGADWEYGGYATSFLFSSLLKKPLAIAKVPLDLAIPGTEVDLELQVIRRPVNVLARVKRLPFYDPPRKKAAVGTLASNGRVAL